MNITRRSIALAVFMAAAFPTGAVQAQSKKEIVFGATAGPYADQIRFGIKPVLEKKGYTVRIVEFNDYVRPNFALAEKDLDANVFQHVVYLNKFAADNKLALAELIKVPTAPIGLYSHKHKRLDELAEGARVALPNDPTNEARALMVMEQIGWLKLRPGFDPVRASEADVAVNPKKIRLLPLEAGQLPRSLDDTDYSFVTGSFALASGMKITDALALEKTTPNYLNIVAVRTADKDTPWARDIAAAYRSPEFLQVIASRFPGFTLPATN